jgi:hypothetical protein
MTLTAASYGDNPFQPGAFAETYIPDQLIAGTEHLVTENATLVQQSAVLPRGTLLGKSTSSGDMTVCQAPQAAATFTITTQPTGALTNGVYPNVALTDKVSSGVDAIANITVAGGAVTAVAIVAGTGGGGYAVGDTLYIPMAAITGATANGVVTVATINTDGSDVPYGILVDTADATGGNVTCGLYVKGEFNVNRMTIDTSWGASVTAQLAALKGPCRAAQLYLKQALSADDPTENNASGV